MASQRVSRSDQIEDGDAPIGIVVAKASAGAGTHASAVEISAHGGLLCDSRHAARAHPLLDEETLAVGAGHAKNPVAPLDVRHLDRSADNIPRREKSASDQEADDLIMG
jgi:hypothetical protein